jgi:hypothetical protein
MKRAVITGLAFVLCAVSGSAGAYSQNAVDGLRTMRMAMSVQANRPFGKAGYASAAQVAKALELTGTQVDSERFDFGPYRLMVSVSADKKHFQMSLTPISGCDEAWFGTEANTIYTGKALGCK